MKNEHHICRMPHEVKKGKYIEVLKCDCNFKTTIKERALEHLKETGNDWCGGCRL
jgi:hypothetical protein